MTSPHTAHGGVSWAPNIDAGECRGCGTCLDECPAGVFAMGRHDKGARVARPGDCRATCDLCASRCPEEGISFPGEAARPYVDAPSRMSRCFRKAA